MTALDEGGRAIVNGRDKLIVIAVLAAFAVGCFCLYWFSPQQVGLRRCDEAIKQQLKAPSTYKRISGRPEMGSDYIFDITYEAQNSFGVPIQSHGECRSYDGGYTSFTERSLPAY